MHQLFLGRRANLESHLNEVRSLIVARVEADMDEPAALETHDVFASAVLDAVKKPLANLDSVLVTFLIGPKS
jgi:hypothetical protein